MYNSGFEGESVFTVLLYLRLSEYVGYLRLRSYVYLGTFSRLFVTLIRANTNISKTRALHKPSFDSVSATQQHRLRRNGIFRSKSEGGFAKELPYFQPYKRV